MLVHRVKIDDFQSKTEHAGASGWPALGDADWVEAFFLRAVPGSLGDFPAVFFADLGCDKSEQRFQEALFAIGTQKIGTQKPEKAPMSSINQGGGKR